MECSILTTMLLIIMSVLIVLANGFVCFLVYRWPALRSFTNGFVVSLAFSDILTGAVLLPLFVAFSHDGFAGNGYIFCVILLAGVANVGAVTYDRYIAVTISLRYYPHMNKHFLKIIAASWIVPILISLIPLAWHWKAAPGNVHVVYLFVLQFACVVVPYFFVFIAYIRIFQAVRVCIRRGRSLSICSAASVATETKKAFAEAKVARVFATVALLFILSWLPVLYLTSVVALDRKDLAPKVLEIISIFTVAAGCLVNPLVYSFMKPDFKKVVRSLFRKRTSNHSLLSAPRRFTKITESDSIRVTDV